MIYRIIDLPSNVVGFKALWEVTPEDFDEVVIPCVKNCVEKMGQVNCLFVVNTSVKNYSFCSWFKDALVMLKKVSGWKRAAIVTDSGALQMLANIFSFFIPGECRGFDHSEAHRAIHWVCETADVQEVAL
jgi:hypothetical protein